jgi:hypothetical protein
MGLALAFACALACVAPADAQTLTPLAEADGRFCTAEGAWCVSAIGGGAFVAEHRGVLKPLRIDAADGAEVALWPNAIVADDHVLFGVTRRISTMYSGGGASAAVLALFRVADDAAPAEIVLEAPWAGEATIRACFGEADMRARRAACHDEYRFSATLAPGANGALIYEGVAEAFPAGVRRGEDNAGRRIARRDLRWERDAACSFTRTLTPDDDGMFQWNAPPPECSEYTTP